MRKQVNLKVKKIEHSFKLTIFIIPRSLYRMKNISIKSTVSLKYTPCKYNLPETGIKGKVHAAKKNGS